MRSALMQQITAIVDGGKWTQAEAAERCGVTQPRMNDLLRGRIARFSLDALVNIAAAMGRKVTLRVENVARSGLIFREVLVAQGWTRVRASLHEQGMGRGIRGHAGAARTKQTDGSYPGKRQQTRNDGAPHRTCIRL
jgi:predicted XRE-type DNA-binding protein